MKLRVLSNAALVLSMTVGSAPAWGWTALAPAQSQLTAGLTLLDIAYENDNNDEGDIEGSIIQVGYKVPLNKKFSLGGSFGYMFDGKATSGSTKFADGSGYSLALQGDFVINKFDQNEVIALFAFSRDSFKFTHDGFDAEHTGTTLTTGGGLRHKIDQLYLYGGLKIAFKSDGEWRVDGPFTAITLDTERAEKIDLHLGINFAANEAVNLRADLLLLGQETIFIGADIKM